jgi:hypothetical protein
MRAFIGVDLPPFCSLCTAPRASSSSSCMLRAAAFLARQLAPPVTLALDARLAFLPK